MKFPAKKILTVFLLLTSGCSQVERAWENPNDPNADPGFHRPEISKGAAPTPEPEKPIVLSFKKFDLPISSDDFDILEIENEKKVVLLASALDGIVTFLSIERSKDLSSYYWRLNARRYKLSEDGFSAIQSSSSPVNLFPECNDTNTGYGVSDFKITGVYDKYATPAMDESALPDNLTHVKIKASCRTNSGSFTEFKTIRLSDLVEESVSGLASIWDKQSTACVWPSKKLIIQKNGNTYDYKGSEKQKLPANFSNSGDLSLGSIWSCFETEDRLHIKASSNSTCYEFNPTSNSILSVECKEGTAITTIQQFDAPLEYKKVENWSLEFGPAIPIYQIKTGQIEYSLLVKKTGYGNPPALQLERNGEIQDLSSNFNNIASLTGDEAVVQIGQEQPFGSRVIGWSKDRSTIFLSSPIVAQAEIAAVRTVSARFSPSLKKATNGDLNIIGYCTPGEPVSVSSNSMAGTKSTVSCNTDGTFEIASSLVGSDGEKYLTLATSANDIESVVSVTKDTVAPAASFGVPSAWFYRPGNGTIITQTVEFSDSGAGVDSVDENSIIIETTGGVEQCSKSITKGANHSFTVSISNCICSGSCSTSGTARVSVTSGTAQDFSGNKSQFQISDSVIRVGTGSVLTGYVSPQKTTEDTEVNNVPLPISHLSSNFNCATNISALSSNVALIPNSNITFSGVYPNCEFSLSPIANKSGIATISLTAALAGNSASSTFDLTVTAVADPPSISGINSLQLATEDEPKNIVFLGDDPDGPLSCSSGHLMYTTSNPALVSPSGGVVWSGIWPNCIGTVYPNLNASGTANMSFILTDGDSSVSQSFSFTVAAVNDSPTMALISEQSTPEDTPKTLPLSLSDVDSTLSCSENLTYSSGNQEVVASSGAVVWSGSWPNCVATITPVANSNGLAELIFSVSDGSSTVSRTFNFTVTPVNDAPTISNLLDQTIIEDGSLENYQVTISDIDSMLSCETALSANSSNSTLLPAGNISFSGTYPTCNLSASPVVDQAGTSIITVRVTDGALTAQASFLLNVNKFWKQEAYVKAANAGQSDLFGISVSVSGDTLAVGAKGERSNQTTITNGTGASSDNSAPGSGAVYVYRRSGVNWAQEAYIKASNANSSDGFGSSVSLSGDTLAVAAPEEDSNQTTITNGTSASSDNSAGNSGAIYVYRRNEANWAQEAYLKLSRPQNGACSRDQHSFCSLSLAGSALAVGVASDSSDQTTITNFPLPTTDTLGGSGAVYVFNQVGNNWRQEAYIKAPNAGSNDFFGWSVSLSGDTLAVSAPREDSSQTSITNGPIFIDNNDVTNWGAVYIFRRSAYTWTLEAYVKPSRGTPAFGESVSLSGDSLAVGTIFDASPGSTITNGPTLDSYSFGKTRSGAAFVYRRSATGWAQEAHIKASNSDASDEFGTLVTLSGDTLVVSAPREASNQTTISYGSEASADNSQVCSGAVYIFRRSGVNWAQEAYVKAANAKEYAFFGGAVSISGDTLAVGYYNDDSSQNTITNSKSASSDDSAPNAGAVFVYRHLGRLFDPELHATPVSANSIRLDWHASLGRTNRVKIAPAATGTNTPAGCEDANAIALDANVTSYTYSGLAPGTKYGFRVCAFDGSSTSQGAVIWAESAFWAQEAYIKASNADSDDRFGASLALDGDFLAVGAPHESSNENMITTGSAGSSDNSFPMAGAVYVYRRNGATWEQDAYVKAANAEANDYFGLSVSVSGDTLVVGAPYEDAGQRTITNGASAASENDRTNSGAVYVYRRDENFWQQEAFLKASNADANYVGGVNNGDSFGYSVSIAGNTLAVGAKNEHSGQTTITNGVSSSSNNSKPYAGAVYIYRRSGVNWEQEAYIKAANADQTDLFGNSVSVSGDTLAVGAHGEDSNQTTITNGTGASSDNSFSYSGAVYVYRRSGVNWEQEAYIKATNAGYDDVFGSSVSLSGDTLAVGAPGEYSNQTTITNGAGASSDNSLNYSGAVYVYRRSGENWAQEAYIKAANAGGEDYFGYSVSLSGDTLAVGAHGEDSNQTTITNGTTASSDNLAYDKAGAVYVYGRRGTTWSQEAYIKASNAGSGDEFGKTLSISGDTVVIGADSEDSGELTIVNGNTASSNNSLQNSGAVYIYRSMMMIANPSIRVTSAATNSITLSWHSNMGLANRVKIAPAATGATTPAACDAANAITLAANVTSYTYTGLSPNTKYGFRVCAFDGTNVSAGAVIWEDTLP